MIYAGLRASITPKIHTFFCDCSSTAATVIRWSPNDARAWLMQADCFANTVRSLEQRARAPTEFSGTDEQYRRLRSDAEKLERITHNAQYCRLRPDWPTNNEISEFLEQCPTRIKVDRNAVSKVQKDRD